MQKIIFYYWKKEKIPEVPSSAIVQQTLLLLNAIYSRCITKITFLRLRVCVCVLVFRWSGVRMRPGQLSAVTVCVCVPRAGPARCRHTVDQQTQQREVIYVAGPPVCSLWLCVSCSHRAFRTFLRNWTYRRGGRQFKIAVNYPRLCSPARQARVFTICIFFPVLPLAGTRTHT